MTKPLSLNVCNDPQKRSSPHAFIFVTKLICRGSIMLHGQCYKFVGYGLSIRNTQSGLALIATYVRKEFLKVKSSNK